MKKIYMGALAVLVTAGLGTAPSAFAETGQVQGSVTPSVGVHARGALPMMFGGMRGEKGHGVFGTVTAVNGSTLSVTNKQDGAVYTVTTANAKIDKNQNSITVSNIAVGDMVFVEGTVSGTTVAATAIHDGAMVKGMGLGGKMGDKKNDESMSFPEGNGQPIVGGTVSAVSGSTITVTNKSNVSYTIDASVAKITKNGAAGAVSNISIGDTVLVQGTINGTSVSAASIVDQSVSQTPTGAKPAPKGFFGKIGNFFSHLFGF
jgi:hypothetical protein